MSLDFAQSSQKLLAPIRYQNVQKSQTISIIHQKASDWQEELVSPHVVLPGAGLHQGGDGGVDGEGLAEHQDGHQEVRPGPAG